MKRRVRALALLSLALLPSATQAQGAAKDDVRLLEQAQLALPPSDLELNPQNTNAAQALKRVAPQ